MQVILTVLGRVVAVELRKPRALKKPTYNLYGIECEVEFGRQYP